MDIQAEKWDYTAMLVAEGAITQDQCDTLKLNDSQNGFYSQHLTSTTIDCINWGWQGWLKAKASAVSEWICVQDKLPKFQQEVLILIGDEYLVAEYLPSETNEFGIQFKEGFWINGGASVVDADLWMPLPQPPKAQEPSHD